MRPSTLAKKSAKPFLETAFTITDAEIAATVFDENDLRKIAKFLKEDETSLILSFLFSNRTTSTTFEKNLNLAARLRELALAAMISEGESAATSAATAAGGAASGAEKLKRIKDRKLFLTIKDIITTCGEEQTMRELLANSFDRGAVILEIIDLVNKGALDFKPPKPFAKKLINALRANKVESLFLHNFALKTYNLTGDPRAFQASPHPYSQLCYDVLTGKKIAEESAPIELHEEALPYLPIQVGRILGIFPAAGSAETPAVTIDSFEATLDHIRSFYGCQITADPEDEEIIVSRDPDAETESERSLNNLVTELNGLSIFEGEISFSDAEYNIHIYSPESFFIYCHKQSQTYFTATFSKIMDEIYLSATVKSLNGETFKYSDLVENIFTNCQFHPEVEAALRTKLLHPDYEKAFKTSWEMDNGFDLDSGMQNDELEYLVGRYLNDQFNDGEPHSLYTLGFIFYGDKIYNSEKELPINRQGRRITLAEDPLPLPEFPGIELEELPEDGSEKVFEFYVSDPILAAKSRDEFIKFLYQKNTECFESANSSLEKKLSQIKSLLATHAGSVTGFPVNRASFGAAAFKNAIIKDVEAALAARLKAAKFTYLQFSDEGKNLKLKINCTSQLDNDIKILKGIYAEYDAEKTATAAGAALRAAAAEAELLAELAAEEAAAATAKSKKGKKSGKVKTAPPSAAPAAGGSGAKDTETSVVKAATAAESHETAHTTLVKYFDEKKEILRNRLGIAEELIFEIREDDRFMVVTFPNVSRAPHFAAKSNLSNNFDSAKKLLTISVDKTKFANIADAANHLKGFARTEIIESPEIVARVAKAKAAAAAKTHASDPTVIVGETGGTGSESPKAPPPHLTEFNAKITLAISTRKEVGTFDPELMTSFPPLLQATIKNCVDRVDLVAQPTIYGGFINGRNPKDIDFQMVMKNGSLHGKDEDVQKLLTALLPPELAAIAKLEKKSVLPPIWKIEAGEAVEITFVEEANHITNSNWTSTLDARYFDLREGIMGFQPSFLQRCRLAPPTPFFPPFIINENAKDLALRLPYSMLPNFFVPTKDDALINVVANSMSSYLVRVPADSRLTTLQNKMGYFAVNHKITGEEKVLFDYSFAQILKKINHSAFDEAGRKWITDEIGRAESSFVETMRTKAAAGVVAMMTPPAMIMPMPAILHGMIYLAPQYAAPAFMKATPATATSGSAAHALVSASTHTSGR